MHDIVNLNAVRKTPDIVLVTWDIKPYVYNSHYKIYRSITGHGDYELIGEGVGNAFIDDVRHCSNNEYIGYMVECMGKAATAQMYAQADNWLLAVAGDYLWQLEHASASTQAVAYCLGKNNDFCPECYSVRLGKKTKSECSTCDGSGKLTSYVGPIPFRFAPMQIKRATENIGVAERDSEIMSTWTGNIPLFNIGDIIITCYHIKYIVQAFPVMTSMHSTTGNNIFIAKQSLMLRRLQENEYPRLTYQGKDA